MISWCIIEIRRPSRISREIVTLPYGLGQPLIQVRSLNEYSAQPSVDDATTPMSYSSPRYTPIAGYLLGERLASGGMGSIHLGLKTGALGFQRLVAIKRLHPHLAQDSEFAARFKDEIRLACRLSHTNIVQTLDVVESTDELMLVMECVDGETLSALLADVHSAGKVLPAEVVSAVVIQALHGLHAAHDATDEFGVCLNLVHRDFSPHNIMINRDGLVKVLDFGIAKAAFESHVTRTGHVCGKFAYISPEQILGQTLDRRADVFSAGVVLWEALVGERLFGSQGLSDAAIIQSVLQKPAPPPSSRRPGLSVALDQVVLRALDRDRTKRFNSARQLAQALEQACPAADQATLANLLAGYCRERIERRSAAVAAFRGDLGSQSLSVSRRLAVATPISLVDSRSAVTRELAGPLPPSVTKPQDLRRKAMWLGLAALTGFAIAAIVPRFVSRPVVTESGAAVAQPQSVSLTQAELFESRPGSPTSQLVAGPRVSASPEEPAPGNTPPSRAVSGDAGVAESTVDAGAEPQSAPAPSTSDAIAKPDTAPDAAHTASSEPALPRAAELAPSARGRKPLPHGIPQVAGTGSCSPPTYTDSEGIRHFKPGCI